MSSPTSTSIAAPAQGLYQRLGVARIWIFIAVIAIASTGLWTLAVRIFEPLEPYGGISVPWWALAIAFYLAEIYVVHLKFRKQAHTLSMSEIGLVIGLFFTSPAGLLAAQFVGSGLALIVNRRQKPAKLAFNLAELTLCSGIALLVFRTFVTTGQPRVATWAIVLVAAAIAHAVGVVLVSMVIAVAEGRVYAPQLSKTLGASLVGALATACLGLLVVELAIHDPYALVLLLLPVVACGLAFRAYMTHREQREHFEFLYESMRATQGAPEFGLAVGELLVAARRLLRAEHAEILLLSPTAGEPALRSISDARGETLMHAEVPTLIDEDAIHQASRAEGGIRVTRRQERSDLHAFLSRRQLPDAIVGALRGENGMFGLLVVGDRIGDVSTFTEDDATLFDTFASHASMLLENGRLERSLAEVTELKEELRQRASHDALTGLPNRVLFADKVKEALEQRTGPGVTHALLFLDLDNFKSVNDSWGHAAGDELLRTAADRLRSAVRGGDTPARLGGDEFAVLLENTDLEGAERGARRIMEALAEMVCVSGREMHLRASVGIALTGPHAATAEELLRNADTAMYTAKVSEGREYTFYDPALHNRLRQRRELALELEHAVERDEIVVHYQPVVSLADGTIRAFEALVRWQHPTHGLLMPNDFLDVAEQSGLTVDIGRCMLRQALQCAARWGDISPSAADLGLWINLAPDEIANERLVEDIAVELASAGVDSRRVTVELTETSVIRNERAALETMKRLGTIGLHLSIDDFGTGYSSLSRLAEFPIEVLKIPKPFVDRLVSGTDTSFINAILGLASSLHLTVVGEGIEHPLQAERLRVLGCDLGQGYLYSPPVPSEDVFEMLRAGSGETRAPSIALPHVLVA